MFHDYTIRDFARVVASDAPAPGGGTVAAICAALGGALVAMVASLTLGKPKFAQVEETMQDLRTRAAELQERLLLLGAEDTMAFNRVMAAYGLPKTTDAEKAARSEAIQTATLAAAQVPVEVAERAYALMEMAETAATQGNPNALSDAGVALVIAAASLRGAVLNVLINLGGIKDENLRRELGDKALTLEQKAAALEQRVYRDIQRRLGYQ